MGWSVQMDDKVRLRDGTIDMAAGVIHSILVEGACIVAREHETGREIEFYGQRTRLRRPTIRRRLDAVNIEDL